ncbi:MAG TPA: hypothetical protein IAA75_05425 [Candidatus Pullichristensenella avicola]|nr:hypothetical protein [Candidatus Pullichristensenella avicola]
MDNRLSRNHDNRFFLCTNSTQGHIWQFPIPASYITSQNGDLLVVLFYFIRSFMGIRFLENAVPPKASMPSFSLQIQGTPPPPYDFRAKARRTVQLFDPPPAA